MTTNRHKGERERERTGEAMAPKRISIYVNLLELTSKSSLPRKC